MNIARLDDKVRHMSQEKSAPQSGMVHLVDKVFALTLLKELDRLFTALFGIPADALTERRAKRLVRIQEMREQKAALLGVHDSKPLPEKIAQEVLSGTMVEEDEDIQELWANLLANHDAGAETSTLLVRLLKDLDGRAAHVLLHFWNKYLSIKPELDASTSHDQLMITSRRCFVCDTELQEQLGPWAAEARVRLQSMGVIEFVPTGSIEIYYVLAEIGYTLCRTVTGPKVSTTK